MERRIAAAPSARFGAAGKWLGLSRKWGPRVMRGLIREASTPMKRSPHVPVPQQWNPNLITAAWIGHASVLINFYGLTILTDPVLSRRIGPTIGPATIGFRRLVAPALRLKDLPLIELILLSHAH